MIVGGFVFPMLCAALVATATRRPDVEGVKQSNDRVKVLVLGIEEKARDNSSCSLSISLEGMLFAQLKEAKNIQLIPSLNPIDFVIRQQATQIDKADAEHIGSQVRADYVVWGNYEVKNLQALITLKCLDIENGRFSEHLIPKVTNDSEFFFAALVLRDMGVKLTTAELNRMRICWSSSIEALGAFSCAVANHKSGGPRLQTEAWLEKAIQADPGFVEALCFLVGIIDAKKDSQRIEVSVLDALKLKPENAILRATWGLVLWRQGNLSGARQEYLAAIKSDPDDLQALLRLGELYEQSNMLQEAISVLTKASKLTPSSALMHAKLASLYATRGDVNQAKSALEMAEQVVSQTSSDDVVAEETICRTYSVLGDSKRAFLHYMRLEDFLTRAKNGQMDGSVQKALETILQRCRANLPPILLTNTPPKEFQEDELTALIRQKGKAINSAEIVSPIAWTLPMRRWALEITAGATNDLQKAKMINDALAKRAVRSQLSFEQMRTAEQVFAQWSKGDTAFRCQELGYFFVGLARSIGLKAYLVSVEETYDGHSDPHVCAAIVVANRMMLADPSFWIGVQHKNFTILDDLQTVALHLSSGRDEAKCRFASQLSGELLFTHLALFIVLANQDRWPEAQECYARIKEISATNAMTYYASARIHLAGGDTNAAIEHLSVALKLAPERDALHVLRGDICFQLGLFDDARIAYQTALTCPVDREVLTATRQALAMLDAEKCRVKLDWDCALAKYNEAIEEHPSPEAYHNRGSVKVAKGDFLGAIGDFTAAIQQNTNLDGAYNNRGYAKQASGDLEGALQDYDVAIRLNPRSAEAYRNRGSAKRLKGELESATSDFEKALQLKPKSE